MENLQSLFLCQNKLKFLPREFGTLPKLTQLDLSKNMLEIGEHSTWEWLKNSVKDNLSQLDIHCNLVSYAI